MAPTTTTAPTSSDSMEYHHDNTLQDDENWEGNPRIMAHLTTAASIANACMQNMSANLIAGASVASLCAAADAFLLSRLGSLHPKSREVGIAHPCSISLNAITANNVPSTPGCAQDALLVAGDVAKIRLGVHVDGYAALLSHTLIVHEQHTTSSAQPTQGRAADVICAAYYASEAAARLMRAGTPLRTIQYQIHQIAAAFNCIPVTEGLPISSFEMMRYLPEYSPCAVQAPWVGNATPVDENPSSALIRRHAMGLEEAEIEPGMYDLHICMTAGPTGSLSSISSATDTMVLQRDPGVDYNLKLQASRTANALAARTFGVFPFATGSLISAAESEEQSRHVRLGIQECLRQGHFIPRPLLKATGVTATFESTLLVASDGSVKRLTGGPSILPPPFVHSEYSIAHIEGLTELLALPLE